MLSKDHDQLLVSTQDTSRSVIQSITPSNVGVTLKLSPSLVTNGMSFAKYPGYAYSNPTGRARHGLNNFKLVM